MRFITSVLMILVFSFSAFSQVRNFMSCGPREAGRVELDNLCPRLEGVHLEGCCPPLQKKPALDCNYHIVKNRGQAYLTESSYTVCSGGSNVSVPCCTVNYRACYESPVKLQYTARLIYRSKACCFENCPPADYWRQPPANSSITSEHELSNGSSLSQCTQTVLKECSFGTSESCQASSPCPPPPSDPGVPSPPADPGGSSGGGSGSGGGGSGGGSGSSGGGTSPAPAPAPVAPSGS